MMFSYVEYQICEMCEMETWDLSGHVCEMWIGFVWGLDMEYV